VLCRALRGVSWRKARAAEEEVEALSCEQLLLIDRAVMLVDKGSTRMPMRSSKVVAKIEDDSAFLPEQQESFLRMNRHHGLENLDADADQIADQSRNPASQPQKDISTRLPKWLSLFGPRAHSPCLVARMRGHLLHITQPFWLPLPCSFGWGLYIK
jgi:hypothetical protein